MNIHSSLLADTLRGLLDDPAVAERCRLAAARLAADVSLAPLFSDGAVLQRDKPVAIWGRADAAWGRGAEAWAAGGPAGDTCRGGRVDRKSTRLNSSH